MKKEVTFVERILNFLKGDTEKAKVERFHKRLVKQLTNTIKVEENSLDDLREKLIDAEEVLERTIEEIDVTRLDTTERIDAYVSDYLEKIKAAESRVEYLEEQIADKLAVIKEANRFVEMFK